MLFVAVALLSVVTVGLTDAQFLFFEPRYGASSQEENIICPDKGECPAKTTCCLLTTGKYGCCPMPEATCCDDNQHCCPHNYRCDTEHERCVENTDGDIVPYTTVQSSPSQTRKIINGVFDNVCPDKSSCKSGETCCLLASGGYGCCPYPEAVCCSDGAHCCPNAYTCNLSAQTCDKQGYESIAFVKSQKSQSVECPDGSTCSDGQTCCQLATGGYGCCPYPNAVCCSDGHHCCPNGYTCNLAAQTCDKAGLESIPYTRHTSPVKSIYCPDTSECPEEFTCCLLYTGKYGCCPYPLAVCCSDGAHCCPSGYTCNLKKQSCDKSGYESIPFSTPRLSDKPNVKSVQCPDSSQCPDGYTCCLLTSGKYGCCPYPQAVCCSDGVHCCPNGYTCDTTSQTCNKAGHSVPMRLSVAASTVKDVVCPDGSSECPDGTTCCLMASGEYGCCPYPDAVCCSDKEHCCPNGYTCDVTECVKNGKTVPWSKKIPALKNTPAGDWDCHCDTGTTCCGKKCCPFENAVCCADGNHCCPSETSCDDDNAMCKSVSNSLMFTWHQMAKKTAINSTPKSRNSNDGKTQECPDKSKCPDESTCCEMQSGGYACCPLKNAVCCSDKEHCCPENTECDVEHSRCVLADNQIAGIWLPWQFNRRR